MTPRYGYKQINIHIFIGLITRERIHPKKSTDGPSDFLPVILLETFNIRF